MVSDDGAETEYNTTRHSLLDSSPCEASRAGSQLQRGRLCITAFTASFVLRPASCNPAEPAWGEGLIIRARGAGLMIPNLHSLPLHG